MALIFRYYLLGYFYSHAQKACYSNWPFSALHPGLWIPFGLDCQSVVVHANSTPTGILNLGWGEVGNFIQYKQWYSMAVEKVLAVKQLNCDALVEAKSVLWWAPSLVQSLQFDWSKGTILIGLNRAALTGQRCTAFRLNGKRLRPL